MGILLDQFITGVIVPALLTPCLFIMRYARRRTLAWAINLVWVLLVCGCLYAWLIGMANTYQSAVDVSDLIRFWPVPIVLIGLVCIPTRRCAPPVE